MVNKIFKSYKKYIINVAKNKYPEIRKRKFPLEYYLNNFVYMLNDVVKWKSLSLINKNCSEYHWKSIYNEFTKWSNDSVFKEAYILFLTTNYYSISKLKKNKKINLFIDDTKINNKYSSEKIGINFEHKKRMLLY